MEIRWYIRQLLCSGCQLYEGVVEEINTLLKPEKRIRGIDVTWDFNYDFHLAPELKSLKTDATPSLLLGNVLKEGYGGKPYFKSFLKGYLERKGDIKRTYFDEHFGL